jgi:CRP-like cAMP-binding protein
VNLVDKIEVLRDSKVFRKANMQALVRLALLANEIRAGTDGVLFRRGEAAGSFFLVAEGVVEVSHEAPALVARFRRGDLVCGYGALGNADNQYDAVARTPAIVFSFSEEDFFDVMEEHFALTRSVLAAIASDYTRLVLERETRSARAAGAQERT